MQVTPYLGFKGECREAFAFYRACLGGTVNQSTWGESPMAGQTAEAMRDQIIHARLVVDGAPVLMGSDQPPGRYQPMQGSWVTIETEEPAEAERVFAALAEGGTVTMPIQETFWAKRFGMLTDRFGVGWMVNSGAPG